MISDSTNATACLFSELKRKHKISFKPSHDYLVSETNDGQASTCPPIGSSYFQISQEADIILGLLSRKLWAGQPFARMGDQRSPIPGSYAASQTQTGCQRCLPYPAVIVFTYFQSVCSQSLSRRPFGSAYSREVLYIQPEFSIKYRGRPKG